MYAPAHTKIEEKITKKRRCNGRYNCRSINFRPNKAYWAVTKSTKEVPTKDKKTTQRTIITYAKRRPVITQVQLIIWIFLHGNVHVPGFVINQIYIFTIEGQRTRDLPIRKPLSQQQLQPKDLIIHSTHSRIPDVTNLF